MRIHWLLPRVATLLLILSPASLMRAQNQASVVGVVLDSTGAVIPNAECVLTNTSTGVAYKAVTNSAGSYRFANVPPGPGYTLTISASGFSTQKIDGIYANVANTATENVTLTPGA